MHNTIRYSGDDSEIKEWIGRVIKDDEEGFTLLLRHFWNKVYTQALTYLKSSEIAQELTQDVFVKVWMNRNKLTEVQNFSGYLFIITRNEVISFLRKKESLSIEPDETLKEEVWIPDLQMQKKQAHAAILDAIEMLPPARKNVFKMSRLDGLSYDQIANEMNISRNGVKDHIVKALLFLRNYLRFNSDALPAIAILLAGVT